MSKSSEVADFPKLVYIVVRWSQIVGVYQSFDDAVQFANSSIAKGQYCDIVTKPIL